jgi:hypothetical protein
LPAAFAAANVPPRLSINTAAPTKQPPEKDSLNILFDIAILSFLVAGLRQLRPGEHQPAPT